MVSVLEALDVTGDSRVLEIGTGTGYTTALLCERLGSDHVTSVDIDPELIELARTRLATHGYHPTLAAVDGAGGYPPGTPYDRIIATCGVPTIPPAWLQQAAPAAVIVYEFWHNAGRPHYDRFGITASATNQYVCTTIPTASTAGHCTHRPIKGLRASHYAPRRLRSRLLACNGLGWDVLSYPSRWVPQRSPTA
jgi:SAM-dependent methyltransferase